MDLNVEESLLYFDEKLVTPEDSCHPVLKSWQMISTGECDVNICDSILVVGDQLIHCCTNNNLLQGLQRRT